MQTRNITLLGATGSIGASTLDVVARHPDRYRVFALSARNSVEPLLELCRRHRPRMAVLSGVAEDRSLRRRFAEAAGCELRFGASALDEVASHPDCDTVMAAIVGAAGLASTIAAARAGKRVLLANKEALVMAGALFMASVRESGSLLLPVDSVHNAVFQCIGEAQGVRRVLLTASGGPFRSVPVDRLHGVTPDEACAHPNWVMGRKISVDSATLMNKGLELIEAVLLFGLDPAQVEVVVHRQSIVHSLVEYIDGSVLAHLGSPDMRTPIAHCLGWPDRIVGPSARLDLAKIGQLTFEAPDFDRFPALRLAYDALRTGRGATTVYNAANEVAVAAFIAGRIKFGAIARLVEATMNDWIRSGNLAPLTSADDAISVDHNARNKAASLLPQIALKAS